MDEISARNKVMVVLLDMNSQFWIDSKEGFVIIDQLLIGINSYLTQDPKNRFIFNVYDSTHYKQLFPRSPQDNELIEDSNYKQIRLIIKDGISHFILNKLPDYQQSLISQVLATTLLKINKLKITNKVDTLNCLFNIINVFGISDHEYSNYVSLCFAAEKENYKINVLNLDKKIGIIETGCLITKGFSRTLESNLHTGFLQLFLQFYLFDEKSQQFMNIPKQQVIEQKANCFCCKKRIDIGYACSLCLTVYCQKTYNQHNATCMNCKENLDIYDES